MHQLYTDTGDVYATCSTTEDLCKVVSLLSPVQKYHLLKNHKKPTKTQRKPSLSLLHSLGVAIGLSTLNGCKIILDWCMVRLYIDGIFCIVCTLFCCDQSKGKFVTQLFSTWSKQGGKLNAHRHLSYHQTACEKADLSVQHIKKPQTNISASVHNCHTENTQKDHVNQNCCS